MSRALSICNRQRAVPVNGRQVRAFTLALLEDRLNGKDFDLAIHLVGSREMTRLNETFLRHQGATDVITFDYRAETAVPTNSSHPGAFTVPDEEAVPALHGEMFVCLDEAVSQARRFGTSWPSELARYVIHGVLHLLGYDDRQTVQRRRMKREENRLLRRFARRFPVRKFRRSPKLHT